MLTSLTALPTKLIESAFMTHDAVARIDAFCPQALNAATAALSYYPQHVMSSDETTYIDASVTLSNPSARAMTAATELWMDNEEVRVLSIGAYIHTDHVMSCSNSSLIYR